MFSRLRLPRIRGDEETGICPDTSKIRRVRNDKNRDLVDGKKMRRNDREYRLTVESPWGGER